MAAVPLEYRHPDPAPPEPAPARYGALPTLLVTAGAFGGFALVGIGLLYLGDRPRV